MIGGRTGAVSAAEPAYRLRDNPAAQPEGDPKGRRVGPASGPDPATGQEIAQSLQGPGAVPRMAVCHCWTVSSEFPSRVFQGACQLDATHGPSRERYGSAPSRQEPGLRSDPDGHEEYAQNDLGSREVERSLY